MKEKLKSLFVYFFGKKPDPVSEQKTEPVVPQPAAKVEPPVSQIEISVVPQAAQAPEVKAEVKAEVERVVNKPTKKKPAAKKVSEAKPKQSRATKTTKKVK